MKTFAALTSMLGLLVAGCSRSPEPVLYALAPRPGTAANSGACKVELRRPGLSQYLDRPQIVRRATSERLDLDGLERWAAPLDAMVSATLLEDLSQRLPNCSIVSEGGSISVSPDVRVELEVQRFEQSEQGVVQLFAQVALAWPDVQGATSFRRHALSARPDSSDAPGIVAGLSNLLGRLSDEIAGAILAGPPAAARALRPNDQPR